MAKYGEKLSTAKWQKLRNSVLERDNYTCQCCGDKERNMQVHHLNYLSGIAPDDYPMDMLSTLCNVCHEKEQERTQLEKHLATTLKMKGFFVSDLLAFSCKLETDAKFAQVLLNILREFQQK